MKRSLQIVRKRWLAVIGGGIGFLCWIFYIGFRKPRQTELVLQAYTASKSTLDKANAPVNAPDKAPVYSQSEINDQEVICNPNAQIALIQLSVKSAETNLSISRRMTIESQFTHDNTTLNKVNAKESNEHIAPSQPRLDDKQFTNLSVAQRVSESDFLKFGQELRQALGDNIDQELNRVLDGGIKAIVLPADILRLCNKFWSSGIGMIANLLKSHLSFFNQIPLGNKAAMDKGLKILDIFVKVNGLGGGEAEVRNVAWMGYAQHNPVFTAANLKIDDYLENLKKLIYIFHPEGKFKHLCATTVVVQRYSHKSAVESSINGYVLRWVDYCFGGQTRPMQRLGSCSSPLLIREEFKLLQFFLSFEDPSQVIAARVEEAASEVPSTEVSNAYYHWCLGGWELRPGKEQDL